MAHQQQIDFCESVKKKLPQFFSGRLVLDIGSLDINGNNQYLFDDCLYLGIDLMPGRNVDIASKGHALNLPDESVDVVVSTECFEHDQYYDQTLKNIVRMLKPGGLFFFSCATTGRPEHGTRRTKPEDAPFTQEFGEWGDYYKNLDESDIREVLDIDALFEKYEFSYNLETCDIYFWGIRKGTLKERDDYSFLIKRSRIQMELDAEKLLTASLRATAQERELKDAEHLRIAAERDEKITEHLKKVAERDACITEHLKKAAERDKQVIEHLKKVIERDRQIADLHASSEAHTKELEQQKALISQQSLELSEHKEKAERLQAMVWERDLQIHQIYTSSSWLITAPIRAIKRVLRKKKNKLTVTEDSSMPSYRSTKLRALARTIYHQLPLPQSVKWKLRERLFPAVVALREADDLKSVTQGVVKAILGKQEASLVRDDLREAALASIINTLGEHANKFGPVTRWIALPFLATGGAEMVALNLSRALRELAPSESVAILITDRRLVSDQVSVPEEIALIVIDDHLGGEPSYIRKQALLRDLLISVRPKTFHNINSEVAWHLILAEGERLKRFVQLYASIFAFQFAADRKTKIGYAAYFLQKGLPNLAGLLSDNKRFLSDAALEYGIENEMLDRMHAIYQPCRLLHHSVNAEVGRQKLATQRARLGQIEEDQSIRPQILWAGRLDAEKRLDLFLELVKACDFADFRVFGQIVLQDGQELPNLPNLSYEGPFSSPLEWGERYNFDAFIFTSRWEGMPNILIEVGALGIPVIAPAVGGVGELISADTGYLLPENPSVEEYKLALHELLSDRAESLARASRLLELIESRHSWLTFIEAVELIPGYVDKSAANIDPRSAAISLSAHTNGDIAPRVSVIVPCYNQARYLVEAVASVAVACAQYPFEIIVVDDGSTDGNTERFLNEAEQALPGRVIIHRQKNQGLSGARNSGLAIARGEFVQFLDADDVLAPGKIDVQLAQIAANPSIDVSICNFLLCDESKTDYSKPDEAIAQFDISLGDFLYRWERGFAIPIHCGLFRKDTIGHAPFDTEARAKEDWLFWTNLALCGVRFSYVHGHWAIYRQHGASMRRSYLRMGKAWLQAGLKIEKQLQGKEPNFFDSMVSWFEQCYRSNPSYKSEVDLLHKEQLAEERHAAPTPEQVGSVLPVDAQAIGEKSDRIVAALKPLLGQVHTPLISVVVPIYGHYDYLEGCINSIAVQGDVSLELICIDDASPDPRVTALMTSLKDRLPGLRIIQQASNQGISEVQNIAVEAARGQFIAFLDCDDELAQNALEVIEREINRHKDVDYFFTDRIDIDESGKIVRTSQYGGYDWIKFHSQDNIRNDLLDGMIASHLKVIRREAYQAAGGCNSAFSGVQDWDLALRMAECYRFHYIPLSLYKHRVHSASVTRSDLVAQFRKTNVLRRDFADRWIWRTAADHASGANQVSTHIIPVNDAVVSVAELKRHWMTGTRCIADLRGEFQVPAVNFVREFNSYFDAVLYDDPGVAAALIGYLWTPQLLRSNQANAGVLERS